MKKLIWNDFWLTIVKVVQEVVRRMMIRDCSIRTSLPWIGLCSTTTIGFGTLTISLCLVLTYLVELILLDKHVLTVFWFVPRERPCSQKNPPPTSYNHYAHRSMPERCMTMVEKSFGKCSCYEQRQVSISPTSFILSELTSKNDFKRGLSPFSQLQPQLEEFPVHHY